MVISKTEVISLNKWNESSINVITHSISPYPPIILRILAKCLYSYTGYLLGTTGHALRRALNINHSISNGIFTMNTKLPHIQTYQDLFHIRLNPETMKFLVFNGYGQGKSFSFMEYRPTSITFDITGVPEHLSIGMCFKLGGRKNQGYGSFQITEIKRINLEELKFPKKVEWVRLITPLALKSIPPYFQRHHLRIKDQWFFHKQHREVLSTVDAGQMFKLKESLSKKQYRSILLAGILRIGTLANLGLGEYYCF